MSRLNSREWQDAAMVMALLVLGFLLSVLGSGLLEQWRVSTAGAQEASVEFLLAAAAAAAGMGLSLWWVFSMGCAGTSLLLERLGRHRAAAATRKLSPAFMRRALVAALSIQLLAGAAAQAATTGPGPAWTPTYGQSSAAPSTHAPANGVPAPDQDGQPGIPSPAQQVSTETPRTVMEGASPQWQPTAGTPTTAPIPGWQPVSPVVEPGLLAAPQSRTTAGPKPEGPGTDTQPDQVTVLAGDTLWSIVAAQLGPGASDVDIALEWPRWYAANRAVIGGSPDVLLPGQILQAPAGP
ncbi:hypothetical protein PV772_19670 [Pseudarthrobacter sp. CC12]|uniref:LysM peptidoglycan-binding domain-containing protein n=1 Tax=Pseudarthrobacter sp. CC12 TaxID=3029193 RepID=UPI0032655FBF